MFDEFLIWLDNNIRSNDPANVSAAKVRAAFQDVVNTTANNIVMASTGGAIYTLPIEPNSPAITVDDTIIPVLTPGIYTNFGGVVLPEGHFGLIFKNGDTYAIETTEMPTAPVDGEIEEGNDRAVSGDKVYENTIVLLKLENLLNLTTLSNGYIGADGSVITFNEARVSDFILVEGSTQYRTNFGSYDSGYYDVNKEFIALASNVNGVFNTPSNCKFIRVAFNYEYLQFDLMVWNYSKFGNQEYIPYNQPKIISFQDDKITDFIVDEVYKNAEKITSYPLNVANLLDLSKMVSGYLDEYGNLMPFDGAKVSDFITVNGGDKYRLSVSTWDCAGYDENKNFVELYANAQGLFTTSLNVRYVRVSTSNDMLTSETFFYNYTYYNEENIKFSAYNEKVGFNKTKNIGFDSNLNGEVINLLGDSIANAIFGYRGMLPKLTGCLINNYAQDGASYAPRVDQTKVISETWQQSDSNAKYFLLHAGVNDTWTPTPIGSPTDLINETFYGALNVTFKGILTSYKSAKIGVMTPLQRTDNSILVPYVDAIINRCEFYGIPYLDLNKMGQISPDFSGATYFPDGLHPNEAGYAMIINKVVKFLENL